MAHVGLARRDVLQSLQQRPPRFYRPLLILLLALRAVARDAEEELLVLVVVAVLGELLEDVGPQGGGEVEVVAQRGAESGGAGKRVPLAAVLCLECEKKSKLKLQVQMM